MAGDIPDGLDVEDASGGRSVAWWIFIVIGLVAVAGFVAGTGLFAGDSTPRYARTDTPHRLENSNATAAPWVAEESNMTRAQVKEVEGWVVALSNAERVEMGSAPLVRNPELANIAREYSRERVERGFYGHHDPEGDGPGERLSEAGYYCFYWAENVAISGYEGRTIDPYGNWTVIPETPREVARNLVGKWMTSGGHRWAMMAPRFDVIGVGIYVDSKDNVQATMLLCDKGSDFPTPPPERFDAPVADPGADFDESYWQAYPDDRNASWDEDAPYPPTPTPEPKASGGDGFGSYTPLDWDLRRARRADPPKSLGGLIRGAQTPMYSSFTTHSPSSPFSMYSP